MKNLSFAILFLTLIKISAAGEFEPLKTASGFHAGDRAPASASIDSDNSKQALLRKIIEDTANVLDNAAAVSAGLKLRVERDIPSEDVLFRFLEAGAGKIVIGETAEFLENKLMIIDAVWALGEIGDTGSARRLAEFCPTADNTVKLNIEAALSKIKSGGDIPKPCFPDPSAIIPGDLLFRKGYVGTFNPVTGDDPVGHAGIYIGFENDQPMVIDAGLIMRKITLNFFIRDWPYYGNRTTFPAPDQPQRKMIIDFAAAQIGKPYDMLHSTQKGPEKFDCVGLTEAAYEYAGLNPTPDNLESGAGWPLTPYEQYSHTLPSGK